MAKTKEQKKKILEELKENLQKQKTLIFVDFTGVKVKDMFQLRQNLKKTEGLFKVVKKTLIGLALKDTGLEADLEKIKGEIALVFGFKDEVSPAKIVYNFSKENPNLKILGGFFENKFRPAEDFIALAQIPSREELLAKLVGSISSPMSNFVRALQYNLKGLLYVLSRIKNT